MAESPPGRRIDGLAKVELAMIPALGAGFWLASPLLPARPDFGILLLVAAVLLLAQGLARDLALLAGRRRRAPPARRQSARCLCVESAIGTSGVAAGLVLLGTGIGWRFAFPGWAWAVLSVAVTATGFALKDYVLTWAPWRIRREADHLNLLVTWKR